MINSGAIRIDSQIEKEITVLDIYKTLLFEGSIVQVEVSSSLLKEIIIYSESKKGTGAYLQMTGIFSDEPNGIYCINNVVIDDLKSCKIVLSDFSIREYEIPFLTKSNPEIISIDNSKQEEIRTIIVENLDKNL